MDDDPAQAKPDSSRVAVAGLADAVVSAGNSGAMLACALFGLKRLPNVERPAHRAAHADRSARAV